MSHYESACLPSPCLSVSLSSFVVRRSSPGELSRSYQRTRVASAQTCGIVPMLPAIGVRRRRPPCSRCADRSPLSRSSTGIDYASGGVNLRRLSVLSE
jgi:hypothetical protein